MNPKRNYDPVSNELKPPTVCVLLPVYNNEKSIAHVIQSILEYTPNLIVINDGSTDNTEKEIQKHKLLSYITLPKNQGKGAALNTGFREALRLGFDHTITLDGDGQHDAKDIPTFLSAIVQDPSALYIGSRDMNSENVPGKSSFGNKFSNFWFWVETGIKLPDTQSGYRAYPLLPMSALHFFSKKYEFEIEVPVRLAWKMMPIKSVPIDVYYPPPEERVTHFRPFKDFFRISVLNTILTLIALLWIHPRNFILSVSNKEKRKIFWQKYIVASHETTAQKASSIGFGVFMGIFPIWGFQLAVGIPLAIFFKMNKALFLLAANISFFPMTPVIWALSLYTGKIILGYHDWHFRLTNWDLNYFKETGLAFFLGGAALAVLGGFSFFLISYCVFGIWKKHHPTPKEEC